MRAAVETLGCKVNQYESSYFLELLGNAGAEIVSFRDTADIYVVHGCAVTSSAGFQTRQLLRRAHRINPEAAVVVAGCYAQIEAQRIANENLATHILGTVEKFDLLKWTTAPGSLSEPCIAVGDPRLCDRCAPLPVSRMHSGRARAYLKVQDGCDAFCSYCVVPYGRGKSRSLPPDEVRRQLDRFIESGYREVVLTGIHLGQWGPDLDGAMNLSGLLKRLSEGPVPPRVRLSSLEPVELGSGLIETISSCDWICPHFHVPLQSGDDDVLARMRRPYSARRYADITEELRFRFPDAAIGADVLVGFPGETEAHFANTLELIEKLPLTYLHVFPFSHRPGTDAASMPGRVDGKTVARRAKALRDLGIEKRNSFRGRFLGKTLRVLAQNESRPGWWMGTTPNYLPVVFPASKSISSGTLLDVMIADMSGDVLTGRPISSSP